MADSRGALLPLLMMIVLVALASSSGSHSVIGADVDADKLEQGFTYRVFHIGRSIDKIYPLAPDQTPNVDELRAVIDFPKSRPFGSFDDQFVVEALGYLNITQAGRYQFRLTSDDGSRLAVGGERIIDHDGVHATSSKDAAVSLESGLVPFRIIMFENGGGERLTLEWRPPDTTDWTVIPAESFRIEKGITRVVSPGPKKLLDGRDPVRPGDGMPLGNVHPSWTLERIRPDDFKPQVGGMGFLPDGRLVLSSFEPVNNGIFREKPNGTLWAVEHLLDDEPITAIQIADGFHDPAGLTVVDGDIYVAHRTDITRLRDSDGDGTFETREVFASGWVSDNYHHFTFGLLHHDGHLYGSLSTSIYFDNTLKQDNVAGKVVSLNGPNPRYRGTVFRVDMKTREIEYLAGGFRTPNGLGVGPDGAVFVTDNQGAWLPGSKLIHVQKGRFFGHHNGTQEQRSDAYPEGGFPSLHHDQPESPPAVWLPQNECANSPTESLLIEKGEFTGQMLVAELTRGGLRRVFLEKVGGEFQGAAFRHSQGFECGINRMVLGPDGCLYLGGTGAGGNWSWRGKRFGLERIRPAAGTAFEVHSIRASPDGFNVSFTRRVDFRWLADPTNYRVTQWHYVPTPQYGGPKHGVQRLNVARAQAAENGRAVRLFIPGLRPGNVVHLRTAPESTDGETMRSTEAWYTLNRIPPSSSTQILDPSIRLLDRGDLRRFQEPHGQWSVAGKVRPSSENPRHLVSSPGEGIIVNGAEGRTSDILTTFEHGDLEAHIEFMVPKGSNSGIYFMGRYEIQIFDSWGVETPQHSDCGGLYQRWSPSRGAGKEGHGGVPPRSNASRKPGEWQTLEVRFRAPRFDRSGKKIENARFVKVVHNGVTIHENVEAEGPTRAARFSDEKPYGPMMLQGDHGPVAFRNIVLRPAELD